MSASRFVVPCAIALGLCGCGLFVPEKNALVPDTIDQQTKVSTGGSYENAIVAHINCEVKVGLVLAYDNLAPLSGKLEWIKDWGTAVTLMITTEDQSSLTPGITINNPLTNSIKTFSTGNTVTTAQSTSVGFGATGSANATRTETIQFTYVNKELMDEARAYHLHPGSCNQNGVMIDGDLKIWEFIYDKAVVAAGGNGSTRAPARPLYNTFTEDITFVASFGGNVTPTWKLARFSANTSGTLLSGTRTSTNELTITLGPLQTPISATKPVQLQSAAQTQHTNTVLAGRTATANASQ
jgi:hypothetical protein